MVALPVLDRKVIRDLKRLWAQVLAIALVMACGVMTLILAQGAYRSLSQTQETYYDQYRFGHIFAQAVRAPDHLKDRIAAIDGVAAVEMRIVRSAILDIPQMAEPAAGIALSLPSGRKPAVNRLYLRAGRLPEGSRTNQVALDSRFAKAHGLNPGDTFSAILNGKKLNLEITGIILSPEFIYALGPGDLVPDDRRFAVFFMAQSAMEGLFDMKNAANDISLRLLRGACTPCVLEQLDRLLKPYGGTGAYKRKDQQSHAFLDAELTQLSAMAKVLPPIFLLVSAFLVNMILSRLIALEREQIGLLKACGYSSWSVAGHYAKLVSFIALLGIGIGSIAGNYMGKLMTQMYAQYFSFPFLVFDESLDLYLIAAAISLFAALGGALSSIMKAARLPPAVAMRPPAPPRFRSFLSLKSRRVRILSQLSTMGLRHLMHNPVRSLLTSLGVSFSLALLVSALFLTNSMDHMINVAFNKAETADARLTLADDKAPSVLDDILRLPGVLTAEAYRQEPVILRFGPKEKRVAITGRPTNANLSRILDLDERAIEMPRTGLMLPTHLANQLGVKPGEMLTVELTKHNSILRQVRVSGTVTSYMGISASMHIDALNALVPTGPRISDLAINIDRTRLDDLYDAVKQTPGLGGIAMQMLSREKFRELMDQSFTSMLVAYITIAVIVAFGVVYNAARIQLSERGRELASLRVIGFSKQEVFHVILVEMAMIVLLAQPMGWLIGYGMAAGMIQGFASDLFRVPLVVLPSTYAIASFVILTAALACALIVRRRVGKLDLIKTLKTRE